MSPHSFISFLLLALFFAAAPRCIITYYYEPRSCVVCVFSLVGMRILWCCALPFTSARGAGTIIFLLPIVRGKDSFDLNNTREKESRCSFFGDARSLEECICHPRAFSGPEGIRELSNKRSTAWHAGELFRVDK
jgi:hypothetical protein